MLKFMFCISTLLLFLFTSSWLPYRQDTPRIDIHQVVPAGIVKKPQVFNVGGKASFPSSVKKDDVTIIVYTRSGGGGNVQLQMLGSAPKREPRTADWNNNEWEVEIWLGDEGTFDPTYIVYAVALQNFSMTDSGKLISLTHDKYTDFKNEIVDVLKQGKFTPIASAEKRVRREK